jgi:cyclophilin family peptidyl-prolyl cis-trans isomerase
MQVLKFLGRHRRDERAAAGLRRHTVESLEQRTLLNATLSTPIAPVAITAGGGTQTIDLTQHFTDPLAPGTVVDVTTPEGVIPLALTNSKTPNTVANFLNYIDNGAYQGTIFHRLAAGFALQGGGYTPSGTHIAVGANVHTEAGASNVQYSVAMALSSGPNSGASEWFVNLANNDGSGTTPNLNDTSDGGPFTVFGNVVYQGKAVVNTISSFSTIDGSSVCGAAWQTLPVISSSGGVVASNEITTNYTIVPALTYSVTSDDPAVVTPSVTGSTLSLQFGSGTGTTQVHVTATDIGGNTTSTSFTVGVGLQTVTLGAAGVQQIQFRDTNKTLGHIALTGKGKAVVTFLGAGLNQSDKKDGIITVTGQSENIKLALSGTNATSTLTMWSDNGKTIHINGITATSAMAMINGRTVALDGDLTSSGSVGTLLLNSVNNGTLTMGAGIKPVIRIGSANSMSITSFITISKLFLGSWTGSGNWNVGIINTTKISGSFSANIMAARLKQFSAGAITGGTWKLAGEVTSLRATSISSLTANLATVGKLTVNGAVTGSTINATGDVTSVTAQSLSNSNVYVATGGVTSGLPTTSTAFITDHELKSLKVSRFTNSNIAAQRLGNITLGTAQVNNNGTPFGVAATRITGLTVKAGGKTLRLTSATTAAKVAAAIKKQKVTLKDLTIKIL